MTGIGDGQLAGRRLARPPGRPGPLGQALILMVRVYQASLSALLGRQCRFVPTCSEYFVEAVCKRGALRGALAGIWRILRCHPFARGGYDPLR